MRSGRGAAAAERGRGLRDLDPQRAGGDAALARRQVPAADQPEVSFHLGGKLLLAGGADQIVDVLDVGGADLLLLPEVGHHLVADLLEGGRVEEEGLLDPEESPIGDEKLKELVLLRSLDAEAAERGITNIEPMQADLTRFQLPEMVDVAHEYGAFLVVDDSLSFRRSCRDRCLIQAK